MQTRVRVNADTHRRLCIIAAFTGKTMEDTLQRMASEEVTRLGKLLGQKEQTSQITQVGQEQEKEYAGRN